MKWWRVWLVNALVVAIVGGHLYDQATDTEHWPFAVYALYTGVQSSSTSLLRLVGVTDEGHPREFPLVGRRYTEPFDRFRMEGALRRLTSGQDRERRLREALDDSLDRYEALRVAGRHDGPPLRGIRLYRLSWTLDPRARNVDRPDRRDLLMEVVRPPRDGS